MAATHVTGRRNIHKLGGYTRDRQGCVTCRRRKKKCADRKDVDGGQQARCTQCMRLNLHCVWESERTVADPSSLPNSEDRGLQPFTPVLSPSPEWLQVEDMPHGPQHRRMALRYYIQSFAGTLSTNVENNGFLTVLLPMAMESTPLMDALIAWSTSHLALRQESVRVKALEDRSTALRSFARDLRCLPRETCLAICLVLTSMESILGNTLDWYNHLSAAASVIDSTLTHRSNDASAVVSTLGDTTEGEWLLRNFSYHDILASVSRSRAMLIPDLDWLGSDGHTVVDTYLGLGCSPMRLLGQINGLSQDLADHSRTVDRMLGLQPGAGADEASIQLQSIESQLLAWKAPGPESEALTMLADSYRSAVLICLYRTMRRYSLAEHASLVRKIQHEVSRIIERANGLSFGSPPECTLLFPLFIAGGEARGVEDQVAVERRMNAIAENREFENIRVALDVLREVWDVQSRTAPIDPARPYDWTCVLDRRGWDLALS